MSRLIGDRSIPDSEFGKVTKNKDEQIKRWAKKLKDTEDIPHAMVMTNNHYVGIWSLNCKFLENASRNARSDLGRKETKDIR